MRPPLTVTVSLLVAANALLLCAMTEGMGAVHLLFMAVAVGSVVVALYVLVRCGVRLITERTSQKHETGMISRDGRHI